MDIEQLLEDLFNATYKDCPPAGSVFQEGFIFPIINSNHRSIIDEVVRKWYKKQVADEDVHIAELEAKIYVYEQIISKSNFAPMVKILCEGDEASEK